MDFPWKKTYILGTPFLEPPMYCYQHATSMMTNPCFSCLDPRPVASATPLHRFSLRPTSRFTLQFIPVYCWHLRPFISYNWLSIRLYIYIHSINGVLSVLITGISGHNCGLLLKDRDIGLAVNVSTCWSSTSNHKIAYFSDSLGVTHW